MEVGEQKAKRRERMTRCKTQSFIAKRILGRRDEVLVDVALSNRKAPAQEGW